MIPWRVWPNRWAWPAALFLAALLARLAVAIALPSIHHPDEIFQSLEQAHRTVFGFGLVPWEFRDGARSWLLPSLLALPMWLGELIDTRTEAYRYLAQGTMAAISASIPVVGYWWGRRLGRLEGMVAAVLLLTWFELLYYGAKTFSEVVAGAWLFAGVFLCSDRKASHATKNAFAAGLCLGFAFVFRFHLAPAVGLSALWLARGNWQSGWLPMAAGGSLPLALLGLVDWVTWSVPFGSIIVNFTANIVEGRSHIYGTSPWYWYASQFADHWGGAAAMLGLLALLGMRRQPLPLLVALVIAVAHSAVAHKEYRFLYPAIPLVLFSAAIGATDLGRMIAARSRRPLTPATVSGLLVAACLASSFALAVKAPNRIEWTRGRAGLEFLVRAGREGRCGVAVMGAGWYMTGGYSSLHRKVPIHLLIRANRADWRPAAFDAWIAPQGWPTPAAAGFVLQQCEVQDAEGYASLCYWSRPSGCISHPNTEAQKVMEDHGY